MAETGTYCKAVQLATLRRFEAWTENQEAARPSEDFVEGELVETRRTLRDEDYLFVHDNYVVTDGVFRDQHIVFDAVDDAWRRFCERTLGLALQSDASIDGPGGET